MFFERRVDDVEEEELRKVVTSGVLALHRGKRATSDCSPQSIADGETAARTSQPRRSLSLFTLNLPKI